jgi:hypothetical protein
MQPDIPGLCICTHPACVTPGSTRAPSSVGTRYPSRSARLRPLAPKVSRNNVPPSSERRAKILAGWLSTAAGGLLAALIYLYPEQLHAPAWVAYGASAAFVFAGLTVLAQIYGLERTGAWLVVGCIASMFGVGAWVSFGPGDHACTMSIPLISTGGNELVCRSAFGIGTLIVGALLIYAAWKALKP